MKNKKGEKLTVERHWENRYTNERRIREAGALYDMTGEVLPSIRKAFCAVRTAAHGKKINIKNFFFKRDWWCDYDYRTEEKIKIIFNDLWNWYNPIYFIFMKDFNTF